MSVDFFVASDKAENGPWWTCRDRMPKWKNAEARRMREDPTPAEAALWEQLRRRDGVDPLGFHWRSQRPMFGYIVDFWCPKRKLVVEVDGGYHAGTQRDWDAHRDRVLRNNGVWTLRFTNEQVLTQLPAVLESIKQALGI